MGEVVGAGLLSHVPTIMLPREQRLALNQGQEISLVPGLERLRAEVFQTLDYDTVLVLDSHWCTTVEFVVAAQEVRAGLFTSDELPRGMSRIPYDWRGDPALARDIAARGERHGTWITAIDDPWLPVYYATVNLWSYLGRGLDRRWVTVSNTAQTGDTEDFFRAGRAIGEAIAASDRRVLLLASGALSHTFWPLRELRERPGAHQDGRRALGGPGTDRLASRGRARPGDRDDARIPHGAARGEVRALPDDDRGARRRRGDGAGAGVQRVRELGGHRADEPVVRPAGRRLGLW
jgi:aromatic ring-opening dioxygenase catalytic subunit (LigB family)